MSRDQLIDNAVSRVSQRGQSGAILANFLQSAILDDRMESCDLGREPEDPRKVIINAMKHLRATMAEVRQELNAIDS